MFWKWAKFSSIVNEVNTYNYCQHVMHKPVIVGMEDLLGGFGGVGGWGVGVTYSSSCTVISF
jgi:hypothetical protein